MTPEVALLLRVRGNTRAERRILERRREFDHLMAELIVAAQKEKSIRKDIDARLATRLLFGMLNSITEWYRREGALHAPGDRRSGFQARLRGTGAQMIPVRPDANERLRWKQAQVRAS